MGISSHLLRSSKKDCFRQKPPQQLFRQRAAVPPTTHHLSGRPSPFIFQRICSTGPLCSFRKSVPCITVATAHNFSARRALRGISVYLKALPMRHAIARCISANLKHHSMLKSKIYVTGCLQLSTICMQYKPHKIQAKCLIEKGCHLGTQVPEPLHCLSKYPDHGVHPKWIEEQLGATSSITASMSRARDWSDWSDSSTIT